MGCNHSQGGTAAPDQRKAVQAKAPILLFCLPGSARDAMLRIINADHGSDSANVRFIDMLNHRAARKYWLKDLAGRKDYASILYLADARDHPTLLLTARTLNWFIRATQKSYELKLISLYDQDAQITELKAYLPDGTEVQGLCESNPASVSEFMRALQAVEKKFGEQRKTQTVTTTMNLI
jgi:hypothetical protein